MLRYCVNMVTPMSDDRQQVIATYYDLPILTDLHYMVIGHFLSVVYKENVNWSGYMKYSCPM